MRYDFNHAFLLALLFGLLLGLLIGPWVDIHIDGLPFCVGGFDGAQSQHSHNDLNWNNRLLSPIKLLIAPDSDT